jgi:hypothetical protein
LLLLSPVWLVLLLVSFKQLSLVSLAVLLAYLMLLLLCWHVDAVVVVDEGRQYNIMNYTKEEEEKETLYILFFYFFLTMYICMLIYYPHINCIHYITIYLINNKLKFWENEKNTINTILLTKQWFDLTRLVLLRLSIDKQAEGMIILEIKYSQPSKRSNLSFFVAMKDSWRWQYERDVWLP